MIGDVEHVRPYRILAPSLGTNDPKTQVCVVDAVDPQVGKVAWSIARILDRMLRVAEAVHIKVWGRRRVLPAGGLRHAGPHRS